MSLRRTRPALPLAAAALLTGCITVNIYFPAPEVRKAAEEIVEETWGDAASRSATPAVAPTSGTSWLQPFWPAAAHAQDVDINVSTAAIRALKDQMKARAAQLKPSLAAGHVGIGRDGMLVVRNLDGVPLRDQATVRRLVEAENRDRKSLYEEIAKANKFGSERVADVARIFAETWIAKAESGWFVQSAGGDWKQR